MTAASDDDAFESCGSSPGSTSPIPLRAGPSMQPQRIATQNLLVRAGASCVALELHAPACGPRLIQHLALAGRGRRHSPPKRQEGHGPA